ncbi:MAG: 4a-hydroxytetrahydrobiopterin dehydratase [Rhodobiaceae bacterium]|jgi:4a-hydroxytetrahydrobiopterin dehydratase|nr:4a-hydroxytetrahydrobiopterin dehydratase [Rhodobiaceae bacterium]|tara:strand:+ start:4196 stop:4480 length:285 start_codon:yes stop_codon:yes gene_type:complete
MTTKLSTKKRQEALKTLRGWKKTKGRNAIEKNFIFKDFKTAFSWMTKIAFIAEKMDHHPEWFNVYNKVEVKLSTHDSGGITELDVTMAKEMNKS